MKRLNETGWDLPTNRPRLWLATVDGRRLPDPLDQIAPIDEPERPLEVEFVGISPQQQRAALAAFPGGSRFVLKSDR